MKFMERKSKARMKLMFLDVTRHDNERGGTSQPSTAASRPHTTRNGHAKRTQIRARSLLRLKLSSALSMSFSCASSSSSSSEDAVGFSNMWLSIPVAARRTYSQDSTAAGDGENDQGSIVAVPEIDRETSLNPDGPGHTTSGWARHPFGKLS